MSALTPVDLFRETPFSESDQIRRVIRYETLALFLIYLTVGLTGYSKFGSELTAFDCGNILLNAEFSKSPIILCNFLIVFFVCLNSVIKFKPAKDLIHGMVRDRARDSKLWHYFVVLLIHLFITALTCAVVSLRIPLHKFLIVVAGFTGPAVYFVYPFVAYYRTFYFDRRRAWTRTFYCLLIFVGLFFNLTTIGSVVFSFFFDFTGTLH